MKKIKTIQQLIIAREISQGNVAKGMGITRRTLCTKMKDPKSFDHYEAESLRKILEIDLDQWQNILTGKNILIDVKN